MSIGDLTYKALDNIEAMQGKYVYQYHKSECVVKRSVWRVKSETEREAFSNSSPNVDGIYKVAKQMDRTKQDVFGENCATNDAESCFSMVNII